MKKEDVELSVVIPVYNEELAIAEVVSSLDENLKGINKEIIVVDDGSFDKTGEILKELESSGLIRIFRHQANQGYGSALKTGINQASGRWILTIDGDGTYPSEKAREIFELGIKEKGMVVASRKGRVVEPFYRKFFKWIIRLLVEWLSGINIDDLNSGMRLFPRDVAKRFFPLLPEKFSFSSTLSIIWLSEGLPIYYVPIDYKARLGRSKFMVQDALWLLILVFRTVIYFNPLKFFIPLSIFLLLLSLFIGFFSTFYFGKFMDVTTLVIFLSGIQLFAIGLLADLLIRLKR